LSVELKKQIRAKEQQLRRLDPAFRERERAQFKKWYRGNREKNIAQSLAWNQANSDRKNASNSRYAKSPKGKAFSMAL